jgi:hypothetical protein
VFRSADSNLSDFLTADSSQSGWFQFVPSYQQDHLWLHVSSVQSLAVDQLAPEAAAEQNMDLEPHWLVVAAVLEMRNLRPAVLQAGC